MPRLDLDAYLEKIHYRGSIAATEEVLNNLVRAHVVAIPFENLDVLWGRPISLDLAVLESKLVRGKRGGYCFEHNTLFAAVLETIGFSVTRLGARVRWQAPTPRPRTHTLLEVALPDGPRVVDVGFGALGLRRALRLEEGDQPTLDRTLTVRREPHLLVLALRNPDGTTSDLYAFTREPLFPIDYEMGNWFAATHPSSYFRHHLLAMRSDEEGERLLVDTELSVRRGGTTEKRRLSTRRELVATLRDGFGIAMPEEEDALEMISRVAALGSVGQSAEVLLSPRPSGL